jgi:hypothetical protein
MESQGYKKFQTLTWYKYNQNFEGASMFVHAVEHCMIGCRSSDKSYQFALPANPLMRHNFIYGQTKRRPHIAPDSLPINPCQKPLYVSELFAKTFCAPNSVALVVGAGAGGDVEGFIKAGVNVIAFESDKRQVDALAAVWTKYESLASAGKNPWPKNPEVGHMGHVPVAGDLPSRLVKPFLTYMESEECQEVKEQLQLEDSSKVPETVKCSSCAKPILEDPILKCAMCPFTVCGPCDEAIKEAADYNPVDVFFCGEGHAASHKASVEAEESTEVTQPTPPEQEDTA